MKSSSSGSSNISNGGVISWGTSKFELLIFLTMLHVIFGSSEEVVLSSYAKVSKNGQEAEGRGQNDGESWIGRTFDGRRNIDGNLDQEEMGRSVKNIHITVSPVYVPPRSQQKLKNGEAVDYSSTEGYSTLDKELLAKLDAATMNNKKLLHDRFSPHAHFDQNEKPNSPPKSIGPSDLTVNSEIPSFARPPYIGPYSYKPSDYVVDSYKSPSNADQNGDIDFPKFIDDSETDDQKDAIMSNPLQFDDDDDDDNSNDDHNHHHHHHQEDHRENEEEQRHRHPPHVIYEQPPHYYLDDHYHHHHHPPPPPHYHFHEEEEEHHQEVENDQRLDKRPYSYYYIGKKLWYIPLYFSIYFIIYIAALVLKSIARHKIKFPEHLAEIVSHGRSKQEHDQSWWNLTATVLEGVERFAERFGKGS